MKNLRLALASLPLLAATPAFAHTGAGHTHAFLDGLAHPIGGADHVAAMVTVGLFASLLGGRALWAVPAAFVTMMIAGGALGIAGFELPAVELGITLSVIVIGAVTALGLHWRTTAAMALGGFFAIFHGYAHGAEMTPGADAVGYSLGFAAATAVLHAAGLAAGYLCRRDVFVRLAGAGIAAGGLHLISAG